MMSHFTFKFYLYFVLLGENEYNCQRCQKKTRATRSTSLYHLPRYLIISLMRFQKNNLTKKVTTFVKFERERLELKEYLSPEAESANEVSTYRLVGAVNNIGHSVRQGHYTAFCRRPGDGHSDVWFVFNDQNVAEMQAKDVVSSNAYILLYERASS